MAQIAVVQPKTADRTLRPLFIFPTFWPPQGA
jgi:hypothetical protein